MSNLLAGRFDGDLSGVALIVGVSGQTGSYLARRLVGRGLKVVGTTRDDDPRNLWRLEKLGVLGQVDIELMSPSDFGSVFSVLDKLRPESAFFLGGQSSVGLSFHQPSEALESIAHAVQNILEALRLLELDTKFVNSASTDMFGNQPGVLLDEMSPMRPVSPYGVAKLASFGLTVQYREAFKKWCSNAILSNHESPLRGAGFVSSKIVSELEKLREGEVDTLKFGNLSVVRDWLWADDVASALLAIAELPRPDDFVVGSGDSHSLKELIFATGEAFDIDTNHFLQSDASLLRPNEIESVYLNTKKLRNATGWVPEVSFREIASRLARRAI